MLVLACWPGQLSDQLLLVVSRQLCCSATTGTTPTAVQNCQLQAAICRDMLNNRRAAVESINKTQACCAVHAIIAI
jgi:hypothetical protein